MVTRVGKATGRPLQVLIETSAPSRRYLLDVGEAVRLDEVAGSEAAPASMALPAEALLRLAYGRLDPAHTPAMQLDGVSLDDLRALFPGF